MPIADAAARLSFLALRTAPVGFAGEAEAEVKGELVRGLARMLTALVAQKAKLTQRVIHGVAELPDGRIVTSFSTAGGVLRGPDAG